MVNQSFDLQLQEVKSHYDAGDFDLAHRRLLDSVIETAHMPAFQQALSYCDWLEENEKRVSREEVRFKAVELLSRLAAIPVQDGWNNNSLLSADNISKQYANGNFSLKDVTLSLNKGEIIGLVGENGNGKTTLMRLLSSELLPDHGSLQYHFAGDKTELYDLRAQLLYVPQRIPRWWGSLMENLQFTVAHQSVKPADNLLWAEIMVARLGLRPYKNLSWTRLSSGYRTKFELAKNLLRNPQILLLDEPLANLDINAQQTVLQDLKFLSRSISRPFGMMISSQHIYEVEKVSDKIVFLKNGQPTYQSQAAAETGKETVVEHLVLEIEATADRNELVDVLAQLQVEKIQYNGNVFIVYFPGNITMSTALATLAASNIEINAVRNISRSSRRFFAN